MDESISQDPKISSCLLCVSEDVASYVQAYGRPHERCMECGLIFVPRHLHPNARDERRRYETHNNDPSDEGYRAFLRRLTNPLTKRVSPPAHGLDFGSGPGPTLSIMLEELGYEMTIYDPFFAPAGDVMDRTYDFITCTETAEHFHDPAEEFERLHGMLRPGGWLAVMTSWADGKNFKRWSYAHDATHVCFYQARTMAWIAARFGYHLELPRRNVALFRKQAAGSAGSNARSVNQATSRR